MIATLIIGTVSAFCWVLGEFVGAGAPYQAEVRRVLHLLETGVISGQDRRRRGRARIAGVHVSSRTR